MFKNVGKELKELAESQVVIKTVLSIPVALVIVIIGFVINKNERGDAGWVVCVALILGALYVFGSYQKARLEAIRLYAFGQLVDKVDSIEKNVWYNTPPVTTNQQEEMSDPEVKFERQVTTPVIFDEPVVASNLSLGEKESVENQWICKKCSTINPYWAVTCKKCGTHK